MSGDAIESVPHGDAIFIKVPFSLHTLKIIYLTQACNIFLIKYHISLIYMLLLIKKKVLTYFTVKNTKSINLYLLTSYIRL